MYDMYKYDEITDEFLERINKYAEKWHNGHRIKNARKTVCAMAGECMDQLENAFDAGEISEEEYYDGIELIDEMAVGFCTFYGHPVEWVKTYHPDNIFLDRFLDCLEDDD